MRALLLVLLLAGCSAIPEITGLVSGGIAGGASANPAVGFGVGVATAAVADYGLKYVTKRWHRSEQDAIAAVAGALPEGGRAPWKIRHDLPFGNEHGRLQVVRVIENPLAACKEVLFSIQDGDDPEAWYLTDVCRQEARWKWASAEPAVGRWGLLQ